MSKQTLQLPEKYQRRRAFGRSQCEDRNADVVLRDLHKSFGSNEVLRGVDLQVCKGETMAIIGGSGTGKSVTLKLIIGLMKPDRGAVLINGVDLCCVPFDQLLKLRQKMGMVFQGAALFDSLNVLENVAIGLRKHRRMREEEIREKVRQCLALVGLHDLEDRMPSDLSGGMKKRVAIARAIAMDPQILLYDEPTTGLDPQRANSINDLIAELQEKMHTTSIVVTHDMNSVYRVADRVALLKNGRIHFVGTPEQLRESDDPAVRNFVEGREELEEALI